MPLTLKPEYTVAMNASTIYLKDKTGAYDATTNPGGWGVLGDPNPDLNQSCVFALAIRNDSGGDQYSTPTSPELVYDPLAANNKETAFEFAYKNDGTYTFILGRLPVSEDGGQYLDDTLIAENDFFYWVGKVWQMIAGIPEERITSDLIDEPSVPQTKCEDIIASRLAIQKQILYKDYRKNRELKCDDAEPIFQELLKLREDIQGAIYAYYSGLKVEAQDQIESLLDKYQLI